MRGHGNDEDEGTRSHLLHQGGGHAGDLGIPGVAALGRGGEGLRAYKAVEAQAGHHAAAPIKTRVEGVDDGGAVARGLGGGAQAGQAGAGEGLVGVEAVQPQRGFGDASQHRELGPDSVGTPGRHVQGTMADGGGLQGGPVRQGAGQGGMQAGRVHEGLGLH